MTAWTSDELTKIGAAEELQLASRRPDGTLRNPVTMWVVRHGDCLYVRSVNGPTAPGSVAHRRATKPHPGWRRRQRRYLCGRRPRRQ
jgi:hypothetical protein